MSERRVSHVHDSVRDYRTGIEPLPIADLVLLRDTVYHQVPHLPDGAIQRIPDSERQTVLGTAVHNLLASTNFLDDYEEAGMVDGLLFGNGFTFSDSQFVWDSADARAMDVLGYYEHDFDMHVNERAPTATETLESLVIVGRFPRALETALHERVHAIQDPDFTNVGGGNASPYNKLWNFRDYSMFAAPQELVEAQAHRTANMPAHRIQPEEWVTFMLQVKAGGKSYQRVRKDRLEYAVHAVDTMQALDMNIQEIGHVIINPGRWSKKKQSYPRIESAIKRRLNETNISNDTIPDLLLRHKLESEIDYFRAKRIVREAILDYGKPDEAVRIEIEEASLLDKIRGELQSFFPQGERE